MKYIIYMDVFFMVNLIMDTILLKAAAFYIKPQTTFVRCLAGAVTGSLLTCLTLLLSYDNMVVHMLISYIFIVATMIIVAYGKSSMKQMIKRAGVLYFVTITMGGAMNLVYNYTYLGYVLHGIFSSVYKNPINILRMCFFTAISYMVLRIMTNFIDGMKKGNELVAVKLILKDKSIILRGLIDTGNSLKDPYYGKPVHIAEYEALRRILEGVDIHREKYRLVPFHSLGKRNGLVEVIEFDEIAIWNVHDTDSAKDNDSERDIIYAENKPAIGLYHASLSGEEKYELLLNQVVSNHRK